MLGAIMQASRLLLEDHFFGIHACKHSQGCAGKRSGALRQAPQQFKQQQAQSGQAAKMRAAAKKKQRIRGRGAEQREVRDSQESRA